MTDKKYPIGMITLWATPFQWIVMRYIIVIYIYICVL